MAPQASRAAIPLGVAHFSAIMMPPEDFVRLAARSGFSSVGLRLHPAFPGAPFYELPQGSQAAHEFASVLLGEGMRVFDIEFFVLDSSFRVSSVEHIVASAAEIGARRLSVCGDDEDRGRLIANFSALCELARQYGMAVDMENMGWRVVKTYADSLDLVAACQMENAGALVDGIHFFRNGSSAAEILAEPGRVKHVQLCDARGPAPRSPTEMVAEARGGRLAPGEGELPLRDLIAATPKDATISVEVPLVGSMVPLEHLKHLYWKTAELLTHNQKD